VHSHKPKTAAPAGVDIKKMHVKERSLCPSSASHRHQQGDAERAKKGRTTTLGWNIALLKMWHFAFVAIYLDWRMSVQVFKKPIGELSFEYAG
jgi:hypothetical protein